jgi:hypothetical protein
MITLLCCVFGAAVAAFVFGAALGRRGVVTACPHCDSLETVQLTRIHRCLACGVAWDIETGQLAECRR